MKRRSVPIAIVNRILERDNYTCQVCGKVGTFDTRFARPVVVEYTSQYGVKYGGKDCIPFEIHHIEPSFFGENNSEKNLELRCRSCNRRQNLMQQLKDYYEKSIRI